MERPVVRSEPGATAWSRASLGPRLGTTSVVAGLLLCFQRWQVPTGWGATFALGLALGALLLVLAGALFLARTRAAAEDGEPRRSARALLVSGGAWSAGLILASVWPGHFESGWVILFVVAALAAPVICAWILCALAMNRRRALPARGARGPRYAGRVWLDAATAVAVLLALWSMPALGGDPNRVFGVLVLTAASFVVVYWFSSVLLGELPAQLEPSRAARSRVRGLAIGLVRCLSFGVTLVVLGGARAVDGEPLAAAVLLGLLALIGGFHLALESVLRELPRGGRTLWLTALALVLAALAVGLVELRIPRRATFALYRERFEALATGGADGPGRIGPWSFVRAADPRGGVFASTWSEQIDSDGVQYRGFAFRPNGLGTPFGDGGLRLAPLGGEWFEFEVWGTE